LAEFRRNMSSGGSRGRGSRFERDDDSDSGASHRRFRTKGPPSRFGARDSHDSYAGRSTGKSRADYQMHKVTCDKCGIECEVPFKPTSSKPVYCSDCFKKQEGSTSGGRDFERRPERPRSREAPSRPASNTQDLDLINEKLNKIMKALKIE
jgi:CxxC-x17-CxxC domain-containing protein